MLSCNKTQDRQKAHVVSISINFFKTPCTGNTSLLIILIKEFIALLNSAFSMNLPLTELFNQ
jgi:hypothetical protein